MTVPRRQPEQVDLDAPARQALRAVSVPCCRPSLIPTRVTFVNTTSVALQLQYSTLGCGRLSFGSVPPGRSRPTSSRRATES